MNHYEFVTRVHSLGRAVQEGVPLCVRESLAGRVLVESVELDTIITDLACVDATKRNNIHNPEGIGLFPAAFLLPDSKRDGSKPMRGVDATRRHQDFDSQPRQKRVTGCPTRGRSRIYSFTENILCGMRDAKLRKI